MPFPTGWNTDLNLGILGPRLKDGYYHINAFFSGITTALFGDNAVLWVNLTGANLARSAPAPYDPMTPAVPTAPPTLIYSRYILVKNDGAGIIQVGFHTSDADIVISDEVFPGELRFYQDRIEAGIALRFKPASVASAFRVTAW